jgi:hypothetical protein
MKLEHSACGFVFEVKDKERLPSRCPNPDCKDPLFNAFRYPEAEPKNKPYSEEVKLIRRWME